MEDTVEVPLMKPCCKLPILTKWRFIQAPLPKVSELFFFRVAHSMLFHRRRDVDFTFKHCQITWIFCVSFIAQYCTCSRSVALCTKVSACSVFAPRCAKPFLCTPCLRKHTIQLELHFLRKQNWTRPGWIYKGQFQDTNVKNGKILFGPPFSDGWSSKCVKLQCS